MTAINDVTSLAVEDGVAVLTLNSPPVNALSAAVRTGLAIGMEQALADPEVDAVVLICEGRTFSAGADINEFNAGEMKGTPLDVTLDMLKTAAKPTIAAIHGTALGGGLELALCFHYRVAVPSAKCGLPEVNIGILPGAGGTQRLPRIMGVERALDLLTSGAQIGAKECLDAGLIDELAPEGELRAGAIAFAKKVIDEGRPLVHTRDREDKIAEARGKSEIFAEFRKKNARRFRGFDAPEKIIQCVEAAVNLPFDEGLAFEWKSFEELLAGPQAAALRHTFFAQRTVWKIPDVPADTPKLPVRKIGVVGAGTMGGGIAMSFANANFPVTIVDVSAASLERGLGVVSGNYMRSAKNGRFSEAEAQRRIDLISGSTNLDDLGDADLIIEAVFERMDLKKEVFAKLDKVARKGAILGTNTSVLNIDEIASATSRPEDVIGLHFFSPAHIMRLLEVVRTTNTSKSVIATAMDTAKTIGKLGVLVGVCHGFVGNRILLARIRECELLVLEGIMPWELDRVLVDFGFPMGLYQMHDMAGVDVGWIKENSKGENIRDVLCEMGRFGQKTGAGYYDYDDKRQPTPSPLVEDLLRKFAAESGKPQITLSDEEILIRMIYPMINEGAKILEEGMAIRASDIDAIWTSGYGWPTYRGGPMYYADQIGLDRVVATMRERAKIDDFWTPAPLLERLAAEGKGFGDLD